MAISVVNMIPESFSGETNQDSEPNVAVNPADPALIAASAFTRDPDPGAMHAPIYVSSDGGSTWSLHSIVPYCQGITADVTLRFTSTTNYLYVSYLQTGGLGSDLAVARTADLTFASGMELISEVESGDQPYVQAATVAGGPDAGKDRVYIGYSDGDASMHYSLDAALANPVFTTVSLEARNFEDGIGYDLPQVRTAIHPDGVVYAVFHAVHLGGDKVDVVIVRDDHWAAGAQPFTDLKDSDDGKPGQRVVKNVSIGDASFGQEGGEGELSIAVDPDDSTTVYVAWADEQPATGYTLHVRSSTDGGQSFPASGELWTIPRAQNPALAINSAGVVGFLFQQFRETRAGPRWETHFRYRAGGFEEDFLLATVPADTPVNTWGTYLGDYIDLMPIENDFYGVFCANNTPDADNFTKDVAYQRNHDFFTKKLFDLDGLTEVPISIDPFFFKATEIEQRVRFLKDVYELAIDPLALLLPSDVYQRLVEKWHPHVPKVAEIQAAAEGMSDDERAFAAARAGELRARARLVEEALNEST
jgi:hypothetical protein